VSPEEAAGRHAGEPRRTRKPLVRAKINMARVLAIGEASTAYQNHDLDGGYDAFMLSDLYGRLSARRMALREELRKMG